MSGGALTQSERLIAAMASFAYSVFQITQGLFLHPYQTMQSLVRDRVFFWMTFLPVGVWVCVQLAWDFIVVPVVRLAFSCTHNPFWGCELIPFVARWLLYFCILWQVVLLYLFVRFLYAFSKKS